MYRTAHPDYTESADEGKTLTKYVVEDVNSVTCDAAIPNIVGSNFTKKIMKSEGVISGYTSIKDGVTQDTKFYLNRLSYNTNINRSDGESRYLGNYFAAFTNDGGYITVTEVDPSAKYQKEPWLAKPNPSTSSLDVKRKGGKTYGTAYERQVSYVYGSNQQYLRGLFVDRRFDYDLIMIGPNRLSSFKFDNELLDKDETWKNARLFGKTYNGIEMSYDSDYNILDAGLRKSTAETSGNYGMVTAATSSNTLEYTYYYTDNFQFSAQTKLNEAPAQVRRPYAAEFGNKNLLTISEGANKFEDSIGVTSSVTTDPLTAFQTELNTNPEDRTEISFRFDSDGKLTYFSDRGITSVTVPSNAVYTRTGGRLTTTFIIQTPLPVHRCDVVTDDPLVVLTPHVRKLYSYKMTYINAGQTAYDEMTFFYSSAMRQHRVTRYNYTNPNLLNKYELTTTSGTYYCGSNCQYPTVRDLNVFVKPNNEYTFYNVGCSYDMFTEQEEDGTLKAYTGPGEETVLDFDFSSPLQFINNAGISLYPRVLSSGNKSVSMDDISFTDFSFRILPREMDGFSTYIRYPRLLPLIKNNVNTIQAIKQAESYDDLNTRINSYCLGDNWMDDTKFSVSFPEDTRAQDTHTSVTETESFRHRRDGNVSSCGGKRMIWGISDKDFVSSDTDNFTNTTFTLNSNVAFSGCDFFTILLDEELIYNNEDGLKRCLRLVDFSEYIDVRCASLTPMFGDSHNGTFFKCVRTESGDTVYEQHLRLKVGGINGVMNSGIADYSSLDFTLELTRFIPETYNRQPIESYSASCTVVTSSENDSYIIEAVLPDEWMLINPLNGDSWASSSQPPSQISLGRSGLTLTVFEKVKLTVTTAGGIKYQIGGFKTNTDQNMCMICNICRDDLEAIAEEGEVLSNGVGIYLSPTCQKVGSASSPLACNFQWTQP